MNLFQFQKIFLMNTRKTTSVIAQMMNTTNSQVALPLTSSRKKRSSTLILSFQVAMQMKMVYEVMMMLENLTDEQFKVFFVLVFVFFR